MDTLPRVFSEVVCDTLYVVTDLATGPSWDGLLIAAIACTLVGFFCGVVMASLR